MAFNQIRTNQEQLRGLVEAPTFEELWNQRIPFDTPSVPVQAPGIQPFPVDYRPPEHFLNPQPVRLAGPSPTPNTLDLDAIYSTEPTKEPPAPKLDLEAIYTTEPAKAPPGSPQLDLNAIYSTEPAKAGGVPTQKQIDQAQLEELTADPSMPRGLPPGPTSGPLAAVLRYPQAFRTVLDEAIKTLKGETTQERKGVPTPEQIQEQQLRELTAEPGMAHGSALGAVAKVAAVPSEALGEAYRPGSETARLVASVLAPLGGLGALAKLTRKAIDVPGDIARVTGHALGKLRGTETSDRAVALKAASEFRKAEPELSTPQAQEALYQKMEQEAAVPSARERPDTPSNFDPVKFSLQSGKVAKEPALEGRPVANRSALPENSKTTGLKTVEIDGHVVGMADLWNTKDGIVIQHIEVLPSYRRKGIASLLVNDLEKEFPGRKISTSLQTEAGNKFFAARAGEERPTTFTPPEQRVAQTWLEPLRAANRRLFASVKKMTHGTDIDISDLDPTHMPRLAVGHTPELDQAAGLTAGTADPIQGGYYGRGLSKKTTTLEAPKYVTLVGEDGSRTIVSDLGEGELQAWQAGKKANVTGYAGDLKPGGTITAANGREFTVERSHTAELETATPTRYHKNAFYALALTNTKLRAVERNLKFLEDFKSSPEVSRWITTSAKSKPPDWKESKIPQLRGTYMHPKLRAVFDDFYKPGVGADALDSIRRLNQASTGLIFWTPTPHVNNVLIHWLVDRGFDWASLAGYKSLVLDGSKAIKEVTTLGPKYRQLLRENTGLIHAGVQTRDFEAQLAKRMGMEIEAHPERWAQIAKTVGMAPVELAKAIYKTSRYALWWSSDVMMMQRILELERQGLSTARAIQEAEKHIPSYKIPPEVLGSRMVSQIMQDPLFTMFNRYHYGVFKSYGHMLNELARGTPEEKAATVGKMMVLGLISYVVYPKINEALKQINPNLEVPARGAAAAPVALGKAAQGESNEFWKTISSLFIPSPVARTGAELAMGWRDWAGRKIAEPGDPAAKQAVQSGEHMLQTFVPPYGLASQATAPGGVGLSDTIRNQLLDIKEKSEGAQRYEARREGIERKAAVRRRVKGGRGPLERLYGE